MNNSMNWEQTIQYIRTKPEYNDLVIKAYFDEKLHINVERFRKSPEFLETLRYMKIYQPNAKSILDIGSGNGISAISFALEGFDVVAVEPDPSDTIGAGAIRILKKHYNLSNIEIYEAFAEEIQFESGKFDIVYARQCMHHAYNLHDFVKECARVLKHNGLFFTVRDHVIFNKVDKKLFLEYHPLQKYYGGENAFTPTEYKSAMINANLDIKEELKFYDSIINYYPITTEEVIKRKEKEKSFKNAELKIIKKIGFLINFNFSKFLIKYFLRKKIGTNFDEMDISGRMYSYITIKN
jgi:2-polyprenyl-3-methyl-5-hydroxy-6-metoxy-1,4-benzoquinol methylase